MISEDHVTIMFGQINAALGSRRDFFQKQTTDPKLLNSTVHLFSEISTEEEKINGRQKVSIVSGFTRLKFTVATFETFSVSKK